MKELIIRITIINILIFTFLLSGCSASDPLTEGLYTTGLYNDGEIQTDTLLLTTSAYTSVDIPHSSMVLVGTHSPEYKPFPPGNNVLAPLYNYQALEADEEQAFFIVQVPHGYVEGSDITFYIHYAYMSNTVGDTAKFGIEYEWANQNEAYSTTDNVTRVLTSTNNDRYYHYWVGFPSIDGTNKKIGSVLVCRVFRNSSSVDDNFTGYVALLGIDMICEVDTLGSTSKTIK